MLMEADAHLQSLRQAVPKLRHNKIMQKPTSCITPVLASNYLQNIPIGFMLHVVSTYYLVTARYIVNKYLEFQNTNLCPLRSVIEVKTAERPILNEAFDRQFVHPMRNEIWISRRYRSFSIHLNRGVSVSRQYKVQSGLVLFLYSLSSAVCSMQLFDRQKSR